MYETVIDANSLAKILPNESWVIVDCRFDLSAPDAGYNAYLDSHLPGAVYAHLARDLSGPPITNRGRHPLPTADAMCRLFSRLGIGNDMQVIVYDDAGGSFCARLWWMLRYMGHQAVAVLDGGWQAWNDGGRPLVRGVTANPTAQFSGTPKPEWLVDMSHVATAPRLIDSRDPARYRGDHEPIDPVAGHIPGAVNHFWRQNLDAQGRFLPPGEIKRAILAVLRGVAARDAVFYCGSGVTACHNILASVYAGLDQPRLYGGSWSEWCREPGRPIAAEEPLKND